MKQEFHGRNYKKILNKYYDGKPVISINNFFKNQATYSSCVDL
jgi:hypothetical protein